MNLQVNNYLNNLEKWKKELTMLHKIILDCGLNEDFKWMHPSYSDNGKNIVLIHEFREYCAIMFQKGALLKDLEKILIQQTENTQSTRQIRFTSELSIKKLEPVIKMYIFEAIEIEKSGIKIEKKKTLDYEKPTELIAKFKENPAFEQSFTNLTEGRQRGYILFFSKPKQSETKILRIEQSMNRIFDGYGLNDCTCGLTKRKPNCDGSHKQLENK